MRCLMISALVLFAGSAQAETVTQKTERCETTSGIVADAVLMRSEGQKIAKTKANFASGENVVTDRFVPAVDPLVDWVYTLEDKQLDENVSKSFLESCLNY